MHVDLSHQHQVNSVDGRANVQEEQHSNTHNYNQSSHLNFCTQADTAWSSSKYAKCSVTANSQVAIHDHGDSIGHGIRTEVHDPDNFSYSEELLRSEVLRSDISDSLGFQQCNGSYQIGASLLCISTFLQLKHRKSGSLVLPLRRNRLDVAPQPESACQWYPNSHFLINSVTQCFQPASNVWASQGLCSCTNSNLLSPTIIDRDISSGALGIASIAFHESETKAPSSFPYICDDLYLGQGLQVHVCNNHVQARKAVPFKQHAKISFNCRRLHFSPHSYYTDPGLLSFLTTSDQISNHPVQLVHANRAVDCRSMMISITEEVPALEEQVLDANTGLNEEFILKNLHKSMQVKLDSSLPYCDPCVICQLDFKEGDNIGTLNCGHKYHSCCITHWLLIRNLCPVCKKSAL